MSPQPSCLCGTCLVCRKRLAVRKFRERHPERWRQITERSTEKNIEKVRERARLRWHNNPKVRERAAEKRAQEREKAVARTRLWNAVNAGKITKGLCEVGENCLGQVEGHHEDYSKPYEVRWLCKRHHQRVHRGSLTLGDRRIIDADGIKQQLGTK